VQVGLKDVLDLHALLLGGSQVNVHISLGSTTIASPSEASM